MRRRRSRREFRDFLQGLELFNINFHARRFAANTSDDTARMRPCRCLGEEHGLPEGGGGSEGGALASMPGFCFFHFVRRFWNQILTWNSQFLENSQNRSVIRRSRGTDQNGSSDLVNNAKCYNKRGISMQSNIRATLYQYTDLLYHYCQDDRNRDATANCSQFRSPTDLGRG